MKYTIKFRVTLWYTCILSVVLLGIFISIYFVSSTYSLNDVQMELQDEIADMCEKLELWRDENPNADLRQAMIYEDWTAFYDDNVMLSLYDQEGRFINGIYPDAFSGDEAFDENIRQWKSGKETWLLSDYRYKEGKDAIWIRGLASYTSWTRILRQMLYIFGWIFPCLIAFTAWIGYRMLKKALFPIYTISDAASEIANFGDVSKRVPVSEMRDEFYYLTNVFNGMLSELDKVLQREKQFTSDAAHELRTPISVILGHCEYLLEELELTEECREEIQIIHDKTTRVNRLVSQLLMIARAENDTFVVEKEEIDLAIMAESVLEELESKARAKKIHLKLEDYLQNPCYYGDMTLLTRMLMNLVENGISYGKNDGHVEIILKDDSDGVCIQVKDDGIGIEKEKLEKIWERFYRIDSSRSGNEGFGLGLFMVRYIVQLHGGTTTVESEPGVGTMFTIRLKNEMVD